MNTALTSITIPANSTSGTGTLELTPTDDAVVEGDETINHLRDHDHRRRSGCQFDATITLNDHNGTTTADRNDKDTAELRISGPSSNVSEGGSATFTVTLSKAVAKEVQVAWTATGNTGDYSPASGTVTFAANSVGWEPPQDIDDQRYDERLAVGDGGVVHGDAGYDHVDAVVAGLPQVRGVLRHGDDIGERSDHRLDLRSRPALTRARRPPTYTVSLSPTGVTPTADLTVELRYRVTARLRRVLTTQPSRVR